MTDNPDIKQKIKDVVASYRQFYPDEYAAVVREVKAKRETLANKFGDMTATTNVLERPLNELPQTLFFLITKCLSEDEMKFWNTIKGQHWFGNTSRNFA